MTQTPADEGRTAVRCLRGELGMDKMDDMDKMDSAKPPTLQPSIKIVFRKTLMLE